MVSLENTRDQRKKLSIQMAFLGLNVDNSKKYTQTIHVPLRLTGCSLRTFKEGRTTLKVTVDKQTFVLGHLHANKTEQIALESIFEIGEVVTFETEGPNDVSLVGELIVDADDYEDQYDGEYTMGEDFSDSISEQEDEATIVEMKDDKMTMEEDMNEQDLDEEDEMNEQEIETIMAAVKQFKGTDEEITEQDIAEYVESLGEMDEAEEAEGDSEEEYRQLIDAVKVKTGKSTVTDKDIEEFLDALSDIDDNSESESAEVEEPVVEYEQKNLKRKQPEEKATKKQKKEIVKEEKPEKLNKNETVTKEGIVIKEMNVQNGYKCKTGDKVSVRYLGRLMNGTTFDSNMKGKPFTFTLGKGDVIRGWDLGIENMSEGSTRKLTIPANLAYGKKGSPPTIPGNSKLIFDVKMLKINKSKK